MTKSIIWILIFLSLILNVTSCKENTTETFEENTGECGEIRTVVHCDSNRNWCSPYESSMAVPPKEGLPGICQKELKSGS